MRQWVLIGNPTDVMVGLWQRETVSRSGFAFDLLRRESCFKATLDLSACFLARKSVLKEGLRWPYERRNLRFYRQDVFYMLLKTQRYVSQLRPLRANAKTFTCPKIFNGSFASLVSSFDEKRMRQYSIYLEPERFDKKPNGHHQCPWRYLANRLGLRV